MTDLVKTLIDIYGRVGDFHITPCDGAILVSEADRLAQEAVEQHDKAVAKEERAKIVAYMRDVRPSWEGELIAEEIEAGRHLK